MKHEFPFDTGKIFVRQDEEEGAAEEVEDMPEEKPQEKMISETEMNKILAAREKRMKQHFSRQTKNLVTQDSLKEIMDNINSLDPSSGGGSGEDESNMGGEQVTDKGVKAELSKLQTQLNRINEENEKLQKLNDDREVEMKSERRKHSVESMLTDLGAVKPSQAYKILEDQIIDDSELGDAVRIKTPHGDDFVPVSEYIDSFKEDNPHLFTSPARSGSGAGAGGSGQEKPRYSAETIRDNMSGGMSWEDYEKNREQIFRDIESNRGK